MAKTIFLHWTFQGKLVAENEISLHYEDNLYQFCKKSKNYKLNAQCLSGSFANVLKLLKMENVILIWPFGWVFALEKNHNIWKHSFNVFDI